MNAKLEILEFRKRSIEPFAGGAAVLLGRPSARTVIKNGCVETINDKDSLVINAWRAMKYAQPLELAAAVEVINSQQNFDALKHQLIDNFRTLNRTIRSDEKHYEPYLAAIWIAGMRNIIGGGFANPKSRNHKQSPRVHISRYPLGSPEAYFAYVNFRLQNVNLMNLTWEEMIGSPTRLKSKDLTAIFIDPPYPNENRTAVYREDDGAVSNDAAKWAIETIKSDVHHRFRIAFCGYGDRQHQWGLYHQIFYDAGWTAHRWTGRGYALMGDGQGRENAKEETIWFSPVK
ncbi:MAG: DNA adenine methylase [Pyrinomonadaceae bacterium]